VEECDRSQQYRDLYLDLSYLLRRGYYDVFFLKGVEDHKVMLAKNGTVDKPHVTHIMLGHMCELAKMDLCTTIWKFLYDKNPRANSLKSMNRFLHGINGKHYRVKLSKELRDNETVICNIRNQVMAHNDSVRDLDSITVSTLHCILDEIRIMLNDMCDREVNFEVFPFYDEALHAMDLRCRISMRAMLKNDES